MQEAYKAGKVQFCIDCVAICDGYAMCAKCAPAAITELELAGDSPDDLRKLKQFMEDQ